MPHRRPELGAAADPGPGVVQARVQVGRPVHASSSSIRSQDERLPATPGPAPIRPGRAQARGHGLRAPRAAARPRCSVASGSPASTGSPTFFQTSSPAAGSTASSTRERPAPSAMAASPTASASMASTTPGGRRADVHRPAPRAGAGRARRGRAGRRPAPRRSPQSFRNPRPSAMACSTRARRLGGRRRHAGPGAASPRRAPRSARAGRRARRRAAARGSPSPRARCRPRRPSGWSMSVTSATTSLPMPRPMPTSVRASVAGVGRAAS